MRCPFCRHPDSRVVDSRASDEAIRRRRECEACHRRFSTLERAELRLPMVVKKDGRREAFDRDKVARGIALACRKRPIPAERIEAAVDRVEAALLERGEREIASVDIGRLVLDALQGLDPVAWLRFASVYQELESAEAFLELVRATVREGG